MPTPQNPASMYPNYTGALHMLDPVKGWSAGVATPLDYSGANFSTTIDYTMRAGQCAQKATADGALIPGVTGAAMGLFLFSNQDDFDIQGMTVAQYTYPPTTGQSVSYWTGWGASNRAATFVAKGGFELSTTEYITTLTYTPSQALKAPAGLTSGDEFISGCLSNASITLGTTPVVGVVSGGVKNTAHGTTALEFWPVYVPGTA